MDASRPIQSALEYNNIGVTDTRPVEFPAVDGGSEGQTAAEKAEKATTAAAAAARADRLAASLTLRDGHCRGAYLHGPIGTGKTMLMDLFYAECGVDRKRRVHFHEFMRDVHERIFAFREANRAENEQRSHVPATVDAIPHVAHDFVRNDAWLYCFDEFQVTNPADAVIMHRLFAELMKRGAVIVATSNRAPSALYRKSEYFQPFVHLVEQQCQVVDVSERDFRREQLEHEQKEGPGAASAFVDPFMVGDEGRKGLDARWADVVAAHGGETSWSTQVFGRKLEARRTAGRTARFTFDELCRRELGAADYLALAESFDTIFLDAIPAMTLRDREAARRFIHLIDVLYERRCALVAHADVAPTALFRNVGLAPGSDDVFHVLHAMKISQREAEQLVDGQLFTSSDDVLAYQRASSRLAHMRTRQYAATAAR